jgi:hypothetical protein
MTTAESAVFALAYMEMLLCSGEPVTDAHRDAAYAHAERVTTAFKGASDRALERRLNVMDASAKSADGGDCAGQ